MKINQITFLNKIIEIFKKRFFLITTDYKYLKFRFFPLLIILLLFNLFGNIPFIKLPSLFYSFTFSFSIIYWLSLISRLRKRNIRSYIAHLTPLRTPLRLILFLPLIETISQILRPLTLAVRLWTNLAAGYIIIYIFSFFAIRIRNSFIINFIIFLLILLELFITILQRYIFVLLLILYYREVEITS